MKLKRLSHPLAKAKKKGKYIVATRGPHPLERSVALAVLLRDYLGFGESYREVKKVIKRGEILVDGRAVKDHKFGVGVFDVVEIPKMNKAYRIIPRKQKLVPVEIDDKEKNLKVCKIIGKKAVKGGKIQFNLHDGRNILEENTYNTQDSLVLELSEQKVVKHLPFKEGMTCFIFAGKNAGKIGKIAKIERGWKLNRVLIEGEESFWAPFKNLIVIGDEKPVIKV